MNQPSDAIETAEEQINGDQREPQTGADQRRDQEPLPVGHLFVPDVEGGLLDEDGQADSKDDEVENGVVGESAEQGPL